MAPDLALTHHKAVSLGDSSPSHNGITLNLKYETASRCVSAAPAHLHSGLRTAPLSICHCSPLSELRADRLPGYASGSHSLRRTCRYTAVESRRATSTSLRLSIAAQFTITGRHCPVALLSFGEMTLLPLPRLQHECSCCFRGHFRALPLAPKPESEVGPVRNW